MPSLTIEIQFIGQPRSQTLSLEQGTKFPGVIRIGRSAADCDVVLRDKKVSRLHAEIFFKKSENTFYLRNLTSNRLEGRNPNPIWVNNQTIINQEVALQVGTQIQLGLVKLQVLVTNIPQNGIQCSNGHIVPYTYNGYFCPHCGTFLESGSTIAVSESELFSRN